MASSMSPVVLVTGFHRSTTSYMSEVLAQAGLPLGTDLIGRDISNPEGHFEDRAAVGMHDAWLKACGTDWLYHDELDLNGLELLSAEFQAYVGKRDEFHAGQAWGLKDPRASLCLLQWHGVLQERARYVIVVRHWAQCAQSLYKRHSRELAHQLLTKQGATAHLKPWQSASLVYESWLAYNRRLLCFYRQHAEQCILLSSRSLAQGVDIPSLLSERWQLPLAALDTGTMFKEDLVGLRINTALTPLPPEALRHRLDSLWQQLLDHATLRAEDEAVQFHHAPMPQRHQQALREAVYTRISSRNQYDWNQPHGLPAAPAEADVPTVDTLIAEIKQLPVDQQASNACLSAEWLFLQSRLEEAERFALWALSRSSVSAEAYELLGKIHSARGDHVEAFFRYEQALQLRPQPSLLLEAAQCLIALSQYEYALEIIDQVLQDDPLQAGAWRLKIYCVDRLHGADAALQLLNDSRLSGPGIEFMRANLCLKSNYREAQKIYHDTVAHQLARQDLLSWLADSVVRIKDFAATDALVENVWRRWSEALGEAPLCAQLGLPDAA